MELDGTSDDQFDRIITFDTTTISNSILSVSLGYTPTVGDSFTIISNLSASVVFGNFVSTDGTPLLDNSEFTVNGIIFQIDYTANASGQDVTLTIESVPEPSTHLLVAFALVALVAVGRLCESASFLRSLPRRSLCLCG